MNQVLDALAIQDWVDAVTTYEFPLNERVRTLLRLEDLVKKFHFFVARDHAFDHHSALLTLFEMVEVGARGDLKSDLMQELERQKSSLVQYRGHPGVDGDMLEQTLVTLDKVHSDLHQVNGRMGYHLRDNEFLMIIRSRCSIPGGACEFDLPAYHRWQCRPAEQRQQDILAWFAPMAPLAQAMGLVLRILRSSSESETVRAEQGNYSQALTQKNCQLIAIDVPNDIRAIPEFSANKHMVWVRFHAANGAGVGKGGGVGKHSPLEHDIVFTMHLFNL